MIGITTSLLTKMTSVDLELFSKDLWKLFLSHNPFLYLTGDKYILIILLINVIIAMQHWKHLEASTATSKSWGFNIFLTQGDKFL